MAIRENPSLMREVIEEMDHMVRVMDADHNVIYMNKLMREEYGDTLGHVCYTLLGRKEKCKHCVTQESEKTGRPGMKNVPIGEKFYNVISSPVKVEDGQNYSIELFDDITEQKKIEDELIGHYEKLKADIQFAKHVQTRALPIDGTYWNSVEVNSIYYPCEDLGGDLYDIIKMNNNEYLMYVADVSGHGITASLLTIFLRQMLRTRANEKRVDLHEILTLLLTQYKDLGIEKEQYLTVLFCLYNKEKKEATFMNAGHNCLPVVISRSGEIKEVEVKGLPICNIIDKVAHMQATIPVEIGDRLMLYTDGITEASNKKVQFGTERVLNVIKENLTLDGKDLANKIISEVEVYTKKQIEDDMAIMIAKIIE